MRAGLQVALVLALVAAARAEDRNVNDADREFVKKAVPGNLVEVRLGELAQQKGASDEVRKFGSHMMTDHARANEQLKQIASRLNLTAPDKLDEDQQKDVDRLSKLSGAEFDREYMDLMVSAHEKDIKAYEKQGKDGQNSDLKDFAQKSLPTLQEHLKMARDIRGRLK